MTTMGNRERQVHGDLLDQVADSTEERDNVRRVLGRALTERELDAANAERWASVLADRRALVRLLDEAGATNQEHRSARRACSRCESGLAHCTTPEACERAATQDADAIGAFRGLVNSLPYTVLAWLAVAVAIATVLSIWPN